ncbi:50S ribosomal protein L29 [archaeon]|nr:50S ribosomal protein L29 [archaeon]
MAQQQKIKNLRALNENEITKNLSDLKLELAKERGKIKVGSVPDNPGKIRAVRRTIARIYTIINEKARTNNAKNM